MGNNRNSKITNTAENERQKKMTLKSVIFVFIIVKIIFYQFYKVFPDQLQHIKLRPDLV